MNVRFFYTFALVLTCLSLAVELRSQDDDQRCLTFDELPLNVSFGVDAGNQPGEGFHIERGVPVRLLPFRYVDGSEDFRNVTVWNETAGWSFGAGHYLFVSNINLAFDFSRLDAPVYEVCFDFKDGGGEENIAVNGQPVRVLRNLGELLTSNAGIAPGVRLRIEWTNNDPNIQEGRLCLSGRIDSLLIGGQEFALDGVCYRQSAPDCDIEAVKARITNCYPDGSYDLYIDLDHRADDDDDDDDGFLLTIEGREYGRFSYSDLPLRLEKVPILTDALDFTVTACALDDDDADDDDDDRCCRSVRVAKQPCPPPACTLGPIEVRDVVCLPNGAYRATITFRHAGEGDYFVLATAGGFRGRFRYSELPLTLDNLPLPPAAPGGRGDVIEICDGQSPACCQRIEVALPCPADCAIGELQITEIECLDNGAYNATINFRHTGVSGSFSLKTEGGFSGQFRYSQLPLRLRNLPLRPQNAFPGKDLIVVCDDAAATPAACCSRAVVEVPCPPPPGCALGEPQITDIECRDDGTYNATINFRHTGAGGSFFLKTEGGFSGRFRYGQLPLRLTGLPRPPNAARDLLQVCDDTSPDCCARLSYELPCPPPPGCALGEPQITDIECRDDGTYNATINFRHTGAGGSFFLKTEGGFSGRFRYSQLPLRLTGLPRPPNAARDLLQVCDDTSPDCCARLSYELPCPGYCPIGELRVAATPCDDQGQYYLRLNIISPVAGGTRLFVLTINGETAGVYRFSDLPLTLGPFRGPLREELLVEAYLRERPECRARGVVAPFDCPPAGCALGDLRVFDIACTPDSRTYEATIDVRRRGTGEYFRLKTAGGFDARYRYEQLPLRLSGLPVPPNHEDIILICDLADDDCCTRAAVELPCRPPCSLDEFSVRPLPCADDGSFMVALNVAGDGVGASFTLYVDGRRYGQYRYAALPLEVGPFRGDGQVRQFRIDDDTHGCSAQRRIESLNCDGVCQFAQVQAQVSPCRDGQFFVDLRFVPNYAGRSGFLVFANGRISGPHPYDALPLRLGPFPADGRTTYQFLLLDLTDPTCYGYATVAPVSCEQTCRLGELRLRAEACNPDGSYRYRLAFDYQNPGRRFFDVYLDDRAFGSFPLSDLPLTLNLPGGWSDERAPVLRVCLDDQSACCARVRLSRPQCADDDDDDDDNDYEVWPGDANTDNIANHRDLLNIGIAFGARGPARSTAGTEWEGIRSSTWGRLFADGADYKHADTNGDGVVDAADTLAIVRNYGRTHDEVRDAGPLPGTDFDPPIFVDLPEAGELPAGEPFEVPVRLGAAEAPVNDIYGLAFTLRFDPQVIDPASVELVFPTSWFGQPGVNTITLARSFAADGYFEVALSRTDQNDVSGYGPIALLRGIIDDIAGVRPSTEMEIAEVVAIGRLEQAIPLSGELRSVGIGAAPDRVGRIDLQRGLRLFPNPTHDQVRISNRHGLPVEWVDILDPQGRRMGQRIWQRDEVTLDGLPDGLYILRMKIGEHIVSQRVVKLNP